MASLHYNKAIKELQEYFGISDICAKYIYHRALKAKRQDDCALKWSLQLQNALVKADKCLGINWERVFFGQEEENLATHGIKLEDQSNIIVFRWGVTEHSNELSNESNDTEWTIVGKKKKKEKLLASRIGVYY